MVARNWEDYYHVALRLATTPYVYEKTRHALIHARATCALYDTQKWVRLVQILMRALHQELHHCGDLLMEGQMRQR